MNAEPRTVATHAVLKTLSASGVFLPYAPGKGAGSFLRLHDGKKTELGRIKLSNYRGTC